MKFDLFGACFCSVGLSQKPENIYKNWNFNKMIWGELIMDKYDK